MAGATVGLSSWLTTQIYHAVWTLLRFAGSGERGFGEVAGAP